VVPDDELSSLSIGSSDSLELLISFDSSVDEESSVTLVSDGSLFTMLEQLIFWGVAGVLASLGAEALSLVVEFEHPVVIAIVNTIARSILTIFFVALERALIFLFI
jgi:hypothetical protein